MNFKKPEAQAVKQRLEVHKAKRHKHSEELSAQGITHLLEAEANGFQDMLIVADAVDAFYASLKHAPHNITPYLGLAYLFVLVGEFQWAGIHLAEAQAIEPSHPDIKSISQWMKRISQKLAPKPQKKDGIYRFTLSSQQTDIGGDLVQKCLTEVKQAQLTGRLLPPLLGQVSEDKIQAQLAELEVLRSGLQPYFNQFPDGPLRPQFESLNQIIQTYHQALSTNQAQHSFLSEIEAEYELVQQMYRETRDTDNPEDIPIIESNMADIRHQFDLFSQRLDEYRAQGHDIYAFEKPMNALYLLIETLQDTIEDKLDELA